MLNFETVGTRQRYTLCCRGVCAFPQISADPKLVFANRRKGKTEDDIIQKKYVQSENTYEFGPLLCGKNRDRFVQYKIGRSVIVNLLEINVSLMNNPISQNFFPIRNNNLSTSEVYHVKSRYKEGRYPENMERFNIVNTSPFESEVSFCFQIFILCLINRNILI